MNVTLLHTPTSGAVYASLDQDAQMGAFLAPWAGGPVVLRYYSAAGVLLDTATHAAWVLNSAVVPRRATVGAITARTFAAAGYAAYVVAAVPAGADIMRSPVSLAGPVTALSRTSLLTQTGAAGLVVRADPDLPLAADVVHALTFAAADTGVAGVDFALSITNTGTAAESWSIAPPAHVSLSASSGTVAAGATVDLTGQADQAGSYGLTLVCAGATITGASQSVVVAAAPATTLTLSVPATGQATRAVTVTVTPNGPVVGGGSVTLAATAGTLGSTTLTWADGDSAPKTTTLTLAAPGAADVTMTTGTGLTVVGSPASFTAAAFVPAWVTAATVGAWTQIAGTAAPAELRDYSGVAVRDDGTGVTIYAGPAGGHSGNYTSNRMMGLQLNTELPAWTPLTEPSDTTGTNLGTGGGGTGADAVMASDGHPTPRHLYTATHWCPDLQRVMVGGESGGQNGESSVVTHFGFNPAAADWDAASTWPNRPNYRAYPHCHDPATGKRWAFYGTGSPNQCYEYNPRATPPTWTLRTMSGGTDYASTRGSYAFDTARSKIVHISGGGWFTQAAGTQAQVIDPVTFARTDITFNASAAWTEFQANGARFVGSQLVYAADEDCFYFYNGNTGSPVLTGQGAKVYRIVPNAGATWDMEIVSVTGVTPADEPNNGGVYAKFFYVPRWRVLVLVVSSQSIYFLKRA